MFYPMLVCFTYSVRFLTIGWSGGRSGLGSGQRYLAQREEAWKVKSLFKTFTVTSLCGTRKFGCSSEDPPWQVPPNWG